MSAPMREIDEDVARAAHAAYKAKCHELLASGQRLLARIRPTSKYFGQGSEGRRFPVVVAPQGEYIVAGGPGGQYRLADVDLFVIFDDDEEPTQITFGKPSK